MSEAIKRIGTGIADFVLHDSLQPGRMRQLLFSEKYLPYMPDSTGRCQCSACVRREQYVQASRGAQDDNA